MPKQEYSEELCRCYTEMLSIKRGMVSVDSDLKQVLIQYERDLKKVESLAMIPFIRGTEQEATDVSKFDQQKIKDMDMPLDMRNKLLALTGFKKALLTRYAEKEGDLNRLLLQDMRVKKIAAKYMVDMSESASEVFGYCLASLFDFHVAYDVAPSVFEHFLQNKIWPIKGLCRI
jgi:hypothetical protein